MKIFLVFLILAVIAFLAVILSPAFAQAAVAAAPACVPHASGIDLCPIIPVVNGMIVAVAGVLSLATPVIVGLFAKWLYNHGVTVTQAGQKVISDRITTTIQNGLKFATSGADVGIERLNIKVENEAVRTAANYAIAQSPDLLKKAGIDVTTDAGQQTLVRRITAESMPTPAALSPHVDVNLTANQS